jgi:hypothetical protein
MLTTETSEQEKQFPEKTLSGAELKDARNLLKVFRQAWKNYGLYPEGHAISSKSLQTLLSAFADFHAKHGDLRLVVENNRLLWKDSSIHEIPSGVSADDLIFPLYRDGINWIEFQQGLPLEELACFLNILNKYNSLQEESDGDIVTELIDENLAYIEFTAIDILWQDYPLLDFSTLTTPATETGKDFSPDAPEETEQQKNTETAEEASQNETNGIEQQKNTEQTGAYVKSLNDPSISEALWKISPEELEELQEMVQKEENLANTEDVFDVLVTILRGQADKDDFSSVLDFTLEEVGEAIEQGEFRLLLNLFQALHQILYRDIQAESLWKRPMLERFFQDLSRPEIFHLIGTRLLTLNENDPEKIRSLQQVLLYFPPDVILLMGPIILQTRSLEVKKMILEVSEHLCLRDIGPLEGILEDPDKKLGEAFLPILRLLKGERADKIFMKMVEHPSEKVRAQAVKMLLAQDPQNISKLFFLIDDPHDEVSKALLAGISGQKSSMVENLLLKYMKEALEQKTPDHILSCYETLSRCGSITSFQFLKRILLNQGWNHFTGFGKEIHRQGAATALALMDTREAKDLLLEASQSKFPVIRQALQAAMAKIDALGDKNDA